MWTCWVLNRFSNKTEPLIFSEHKYIQIYQNWRSTSAGLHVYNSQFYEKKKTSYENDFLYLSRENDNDIATEAKYVELKRLHQHTLNQ